MRRQRWRLVEIIAFMLAFAAVYLLLIGPAIGQAFGLEEPAFSGPGLRPSGDLPDTARGWILLVLQIPALSTSMSLRARLSGASRAASWNPPEEHG